MLHLYMYYAFSLSYVYKPTTQLTELRLLNQL